MKYVRYIYLLFYQFSMDKEHIRIQINNCIGEQCLYQSTFTTTLLSKQIAAIGACCRRRVMCLYGDVDVCFLCDVQYHGLYLDNVQILLRIKLVWELIRV